jgi:transcriptional regulator with XRE-family HTH domain
MACSHAWRVDLVRIGLAIRALRRRRGWTQSELGLRAGCSRSEISRIERGDVTDVRRLERVLAVFGARLSIKVLWQGEELDRILDRGHAALVDSMIGLLARSGWISIAEATFSVYGERGSIDILAWHPIGRVLLVIEVKSVVPDVQATLAGVDRKARLGPVLARERGWDPLCGARILVLPEDRTARRRLDAFATTMRRAFPARTSEVRRWLRQPAGELSGVLFLTDSQQPGARHRVRSSVAHPKHESRPDS